MARQTKEEKAMDKRIESIYNESCKGVQIPMMQIPKIFGIARETYRQGGDDATVRVAIVAYVNEIRTN